MVLNSHQNAPNITKAACLFGLGATTNSSFRRKPTEFLWKHSEGNFLDSERNKITYPLDWTSKKTWKITMLLMGKSSFSMAIFHSYVSLPEGNWKAFKFKCLCKTNVCRPSVEAMNGCQGYVHWTLRRSQSHALRCGYGAWMFNGFNPSPISKMLLGITIPNMAAKLISK